MTEGPTTSDCGTWERVCDASGHIFYINATTKETSWQLPTQNALPDGWQTMQDAQGRVFFVDHIHKVTTWLDPRVAQVQDSHSQSVDDTKALEVETKLQSEYSESDISDDECDEPKNSLYFVAPFLEKDELALCRHCDSKFGVLRRRHNCRLCGCTHCSDCLSTKMKLPFPPLSAAGPARVHVDRQQSICPRCARNVATGQFFTIVGVYRCLVSKPPLSIENRAQLMRQLAQAFRSSREETGAGMGPYRSAELNDVHDAGGFITFCKLLPSAVQAYLMDPESHALLYETLNMLSALIGLAMANGNDADAGSSFSSSGACASLIQILADPLRNQILQRNALSLMSRVSKFRFCQIALRKANATKYLKILIESTAGLDYKISIDAVTCLSNYIRNDEENAVEFAAEGGIASLFLLLETLFQVKDPCKQLIIRAMRVTLQALCVSLKRQSHALDEMIPGDKLSKKMTLGDLSQIWRETANVSCPAPLEISLINVKGLVELLRSAEPRRKRMAYKILTIFSRSVCLLERFVEEQAQESLVAIINRLDPQFEPLKKEQSEGEISDHLIASNLLCRLCTSQIGGVNEKDARAIFLQTLTNVHGLRIVLNHLCDAAKGEAAAMDMEYQRNLIGIIYGFAQVKNASYFTELRTSLRPLRLLLFSSKKELKQLIAETIIVLLMACEENDWKVFCASDAEEQELFTLCESWLLLPEDSEKQRLAMRLLLTWIRSVSDEKLTEKPLSNCFFDAIFHALLISSDAKLLTHCLMLLRLLLERCPLHRQRILTSLTEQACFVSLMQILCASKGENLSMESFSLITSPRLVFASLEEEIQAQWNVYHCLATIFEAESTDTLSVSNCSSIVVRNKIFIRMLDEKLRQRMEKLVERMMEGSLLQALSMALFVALRRAEQDDVNEDALTDWIAALLDLLNKSLLYIQPTQAENCAYCVSELVNVLAKLGNSEFFDSRPRMLSKAVLGALLQIARSEAWINGFLYVFREEATEEVLAVQLYTLLLKALSFESLMDDAIYVLRRVLEEHLYLEPLKKANAMEKLLSCLKICDKQEKRMAAIVRVLCCLTKAHEFGQQLMDNSDACERIIALYIPQNTKHGLTDFAGQILASFSTNPLAFRHLLHTAATELPEMILKNLTSHKSAQKIAEKIVSNLADSDFSTCPLWKTCIASRDAAQLTHIISLFLNVTVHALAAKKLSDVLQNVLEGQNSIEIRACYASMDANRDACMANLLHLISNHKDGVPMAISAFHALSMLIRIGVRLRESEFSLLEEHALRLCADSVATLSYIVRGGTEKQQAMAVDVLYHGIAQHRALFFKNFCLESKTDVCVNAQAFVYVVMEQTRSIMRNDAESVSDVWKRCVLLCECLQPMEDVARALEGELIEDLIRFSMELLWYMKKTDSGVPLRVCILKLLHQETQTLGLCRGLVKAKAISNVVQCLEQSLDMEELLEGLSLLNMLCIVDRNGFLEAQGISLLVSVPTLAIQKYYGNGGSAIAFKALEMLTVLSKSFACVEFKNAFYDSEQAFLALCSFCELLCQKLEVEEHIGSREDPLATLRLLDYAWIDVLSLVVSLVSAFWSMSESFSFSKAPKKVQHRFFQFVSFMVLCRERKSLKGWESKRYCEFMLTVFPALEGALFMANDAEKEYFSVAKDVTIRIAIQLMETKDSEPERILLIACLEGINSYFEISQDCSGASKTRVLKMLESLSLQKDSGEQAQDLIAASLNLVATLFSYMDTEERNSMWLRKWIFRICATEKRCAYSKLVINSLSKLLLKLCSVESIREMIMDDARFLNLVDHLRSMECSDTRKVLFIFGKLCSDSVVDRARTNDVSRSVSNSKMSNSAFVMRCYHCQKAMTLTSNCMEKWTSGTLPLCQFCQETLVVGLNEDKNPELPDAKLQESSASVIERRYTIESFAGSFLASSNVAYTSRRNSSSLLECSAVHNNAFGQSSGREKMSRSRSFLDERKQFVVCELCQKQFIAHYGINILRCLDCRGIPKLFDDKMIKHIRCHNCNALLRIPIGTTSYKCMRCLEIMELA